MNRISKEAGLALGMGAVALCALHFTARDVKREDFLHEKTTVEYGRRISINGAPIPFEPDDLGGVSAIYASLQALTDPDIHRRPGRVSLLILHLKESSEFLATKGNSVDARSIDVALERFVWSLSAQKVEPEVIFLFSQYDERQRLANEAWRSCIPKTVPKQPFIELRRDLEAPLWRGYLTYSHPQFRLPKP